MSKQVKLSEAVNKAEEWLVKCREADDMIKQGQEAKKEAEKHLRVLADDNPDWFNQGATVTFTNGKLCWENETTAVSADGTDLKELLKKYPDAVKLSLVNGQIKSLFKNPDNEKKLRALGITLKNEERFKVKAA